MSALEGVVDRGTSEARTKGRKEWDQHLAEDPSYTLTLAIAAGYMGVTNRALVKLIEAGVVQATKTAAGKTWRVSLASLKADREDRARPTCRCITTRGAPRWQR